MVRVEDMMEREKAVFSSETLALQFAKVQGLKEPEVVELADRTRDGLVPQKPTKVYLKEDPDSGFLTEGVFDEDHTPEFQGTIWFDPLVPENARGLALYHSWIRDGHLSEPGLSFGRTACTCQLTMAEGPMLRKDGDGEGVFHCFARTREDASRIAHATFKEHWEQLPVRAIVDPNGLRMIEEEANTPTTLTAQP